MDTTSSVGVESCLLQKLFIGLMKDGKVLGSLRAGVHWTPADALDSGNCNSIRILMWFLTAMMCSKVLQPSSLVVAYETLLSSAATTVDEEKGNPSWQACADFYITCILSCLPWGGAELVAQVPEEIERVMVGVEAYLRLEDMFLILVSRFSRVLMTQRKFLTKRLTRSLLNLLPSKCLNLSVAILSCMSVNVTGFSLSMSSRNLTMKTGRTLESTIRVPLLTLRHVTTTTTDTIAPMATAIQGGKTSRKECASYMVGLPVTFRYEYLMAETIFSQLLLLPHPPFKPMYYTLVIIDLCKSLPEAFPAVVAGAVRALFDKIDDLDMECRTRLILWFSHHLY